MDREKTIQILCFYRDAEKVIRLNERVIKNLEDQYYCDLGAISLSEMPKIVGGVSRPVEQAALNIPASVTRTIRRMEHENERISIIQSAILQELNVLSYHQKAVVLWFYIDGQKWERISGQLHYSPRQCRNIRNRAIDRLSKRFTRNKAISRYHF